MCYIFNVWFLVYAEVAQTEERLTCNEDVAGSIPVFGSILSTMELHLISVDALSISLLS